MPEINRKALQILVSTSTLTKQQVRSYWADFCSHYGVTEDQAAEAFAAFARAITQTNGITSISSDWRPTRETVAFIERYGYPLTKKGSEHTMFSLPALVCVWVYWLKDEQIVPRFPDMHFAHFILYREPVKFSAYLDTIDFYSVFAGKSDQGDSEGFIQYIESQFDWVEPAVFLAQKLIEALFRYGFGSAVDELVPVLPGKFNDRETGILKELNTPSAIAAIERCRQKVSKAEPAKSQPVSKPIVTQPLKQPTDESYDLAYDHYLSEKGRAAHDLVVTQATSNTKVKTDNKPAKPTLKPNIQDPKQGRVDPKTGKYVKSETDIDNDRRAGLLSQAEQKQLLNYMVKIKGQFPDMDATAVKFHALNQLAKDRAGD